jgi:hypothetical protein
LQLSRGGRWAGGAEIRKLAVDPVGASVFTAASETLRLSGIDEATN